MATLAIQDYAQKWNLCPQAHVELLQLMLQQAPAPPQATQTQTATKKQVKTFHNDSVSAAWVIWKNKTPTQRQTDILNFVLTIVQPNDTNSGNTLAANMRAWGLEFGQTRTIRELFVLFKDKGIIAMTAAGMVTSLVHKDSDAEKALLLI
jgi:hypothetical protein